MSFKEFNFSPQFVKAALLSILLFTETTLHCLSSPSTILPMAPTFTVASTYPEASIFLIFRLQHTWYGIHLLFSDAKMQELYIFYPNSSIHCLFSQSSVLNVVPEWISGSSLCSLSSFWCLDWCCSLDCVKQQFL